MAEKEYSNYHLYRTLPKLSGNLQLDLILGASGSNRAYVRQAHLRPLRGTNYVPSVDEQITIRPHQNNIKMFYDQTRGSFYDSNPPASLNSSWFMTVSKHEMNNLKYIKTWDDTLWAGAQRMSHKLYGTTHEILVPVWLEKCRGLKFIISAQFGKEGSVHSREVNISEEYLYRNLNGSPLLYNRTETFHNDFTRYWINYLDYISVLKGDDRVLNVDLKSGVSDIFGLLVESGNLSSRQNFNLSRNLTYRERPLLEANSLITNMFQDYKMICTHLVNFNLCLDVSEMFNTNTTEGTEQTSLSPIRLYVEVKALREKSDLDKILKIIPIDNPYTWYESHKNPQDDPYTWESLARYDFYTNHDYIPRQFIQTESQVQNEYYTDKVDYRKNVLGYLKDNQCTDIIHSNKITQGICHWMLSENNPSGEVLFNLYDGFGAYVKHENTYSDYKHGFGTSSGISEETYNPDVDNTVWAGIPKIGDGGTIEEIFAHPKKYVEEGFFKDAAESIGGIQFKYQPNDSEKDQPWKIYIGTMTTPWECDPEQSWTIDSSLVDSQYVIGILQERYNSQKMDLPHSRQNQEGRDKLWDWHIHSDVDNRFATHLKRGNDTLCLYYNSQLAEDDWREIMEDEKNLINWDTSDDEKILIHTKNNQEKEVLKWANPENEGSGDDWVRVGGTGYRDTRAREQMNMSALYIAMRRERQYNGNNEKIEDNLYVILYHPRLKCENESPGPMHLHNLYPHGLTIGGFIRSVKDYYNKYQIHNWAIQMAKTYNSVKGEDETLEFPEDLPDLVSLEYVKNLINSIQAPPIIYFHRTIQSVPDNALSYSAQEIHYRKLDTADEYVYRYDGNIKPAMFPAKVKRDPNNGNVLNYYPQFGRNFAYRKSVIFTENVSKINQLTPSQRLYISSGIPPRYPSLDYNSVIPMAYLPTDDRKNEHCYPSIHGDLLYSEPLPLFYGLNWDGQELKNLEPYNSYNDPTQPYQYHTWRWYEWKWFDKSTYIPLPHSMRFVIQSPQNDRDTLESIAWKAIGGAEDSERSTYILVDCKKRVLPIAFEGNSEKYILDTPYLSRVYDLEFNLQKTEVQMDEETGKFILDPFTKQVLYTYTYELIATLK